MEEASQQPPKFPYSEEELKTIWPFKGKLESIERLFQGHINETWISTWDDSREKHKFVHQQINEIVFPNIPQLAANLERGLDELNKSLLTFPYREGECFLEPIRSKFGEIVTRVSGAPWRVTKFLEGGTTFEVTSDGHIAYEAGAISGLFLRRLSAANPQDYPEIIPNFHNVNHRLEQLQLAVKNAQKDRLNTAKQLLSEISKFQAEAVKIHDALVKGEIPYRVTHNDLKLNNILFDAVTLKAKAVLDLDLIQKGSPIYDFGDLIRGAAFTKKEDDVDFVDPDPILYQELIRGFAEFQKGILTPNEVKLLEISPFVLAFTLGIRFLSDFLSGDRYFMVNYETHNFDRATTQLKRADSLYRVRREFQKEINKCF